MNKEMSKRQQIGRQQVAPAAFEIRFSTTDSQGVELVEIPPPNLDPQERGVPDPFKKRDKIPRNSGSGSTLEGLAQNVSMPPSRFSGNDVQSAPATNKQWNNVSQKNKLLKDSNHTSSNGFDASIKAKSWNSVSPEVEKQEHKGKFGDNMEVDETAVNSNSTEKRNKLEDESASRHVQGNKKRPLPAEENGGVEENGFSTKDISTQNLTHSINKDLYVTAETVVSTNKENMIKNNNKNRKTSMATEIKDEDIRTVSRPTDGIATPPATPPSSPPITPQSPQSSSVDVPQAPSKTKEIPPIPSPPSSAGSAEPLMTPSRIPRPSPSRPILTAYVMELQEEQEQQEREDQDEQELQEQEEEQSQQEREEQEELEEQVRQEREEQVQQEQEEQQIKGHSRRRPTISHDDMIIPTIAKKLKMNGQLPYPNHDALLGISDDQDLSSESENGCIDAANQVENLFDVEQQKLPERHSSVPELQQRKTSISSKIPVRNRKDSKRISPSVQVEDVLDSANHVPKSEEDKKRKRKSRREEYVLVIRDEDEADEFGDITGARSSMSLTTSEPSMSTTTTLLPSDRDSAEHEHDEGKSEEINNASSSTQSAQQGVNIPSSAIQLAVPNKTSPLTLELERTYTSDPNEKRSKKHKKNKNKRNKETEVDEDDVRKSACCCIIC